MPKIKEWEDIKTRTREAGLDEDGSINIFITYMPTSGTVTANPCHAYPYCRSYIQQFITVSSLPQRYSDSLLLQIERMKSLIELSGYGPESSLFH